MTPISNNSPVNHSNADFETQGAHGAKPINVPPPPKNAVEQHDANVPPPTTQGPASCARDATQPTSTGYAASAQPPNVNGPGETHGAKPVESQESKDAAQLAKDLQYILSIPTQEPGGKPGVVSLTWLQAVANDPFRSKASKEAANRLLNNPAWSRADADHSGKLTLGEAGAYADKMKSGATSGGSPGSTADGVHSTAVDVGETPGAAEGSASSGDLGSTASAATKNDYPSTLDGSVAGLYDAQTSLQDQLTKLSKEAAASPEKASQLQGQISLLTNQLQVLNNMTQMLQNLISNTAKMWNDIAMNAVRNIR